MIHIVETICTAWQKKEIELLNEILADDFVWYEGPFDRPIITREELFEVWKNDLSTQENIKVDYEILMENTTTCIANWRASYTRQGTIYKLEGIFLIKLNDAGKLNSFKMWWVKE